MLMAAKIANMRNFHPLQQSNQYHFTPLNCIRFADQNLFFSYKIFSLLLSVYCLVMKFTDQLNKIHII